MSAPFDLSALIRPGDVIAWGQACGEPRRLTRMLMDQVDRIGPLTCIVGIPAASPLQGAVPDQLSIVSYCGTGTNAALHAAGRLRILPVHYSTLPEVLTQGPLAVDVVFVQVSEPDDEGDYVLGLTDDYIATVLRRARVVIGEVTPGVPRTPGATRIAPDRFAALISADDLPAEFDAAPADAAAEAIAASVAGLVEDGATLQVGIGALPSAVLRALRGHRRLGFHSGMLPEETIDLIRCGAADGSAKTRDAGLAVGGLLIGGRRLFDAASESGIELRTTRYTHAPDVLASMPAFTAINSALEVDLTGRINAESVGGRYLGAVGGSLDFARGARRSRGGRAIVCLPATSRHGSRIVPALSGPVTLGGSEGVTVVTEHGVADLAGLSPAQCAERLIAVAAPEYRAELDAAMSRVPAGA